MPRFKLEGPRPFVVFCFALIHHTMYELRNQHVSTVAPHYNEMPSYQNNMFVIAGSSLLLTKTPLFKKWKTCTMFLSSYRNTSGSLGE